MQNLNAIITATGMEKFFTISFWAARIKLDVFFEKAADKILQNLDFTDLSQKIFIKIMNVINVEKIVDSITSSKEFSEVSKKILKETTGAIVDKIKI